MKRVEIFTDGACSGNPGPGGWGAILRFNGVEKELSGGEAETTNNRMELMAAISALEALTRPSEITVTTDSAYVKNGVTLVGDTGRALQEIVAQVVQVDGNVEAIAEASKEQSTGLQEINTAVNSMDQGTQQNAAMVEETTAASHDLARQAEELFELLSQFKIGVAASTGRVRAASPAPSSAPKAPPKPRMAAPQPASKAAPSFHGNAALKAEEWDEF